MTVRQLREWIEREIHLDLKNAPFDGKDANLLPAAGACSACPKRTGNNPLLFPEIGNKSLCTDPACYRAKVQALVQLRVEPLVKRGQTARSDLLGSLLAGAVQSLPTRCTKANIAVWNARESARTHRPQSSWTAARQGRSCAFVPMRVARRTGNSLITKSRHRSGNSAENSRSQFGFRRSRVRAFCRPSGRASSCIGACGFRDGCTRLFPTTRS